MTRKLRAGLLVSSLVLVSAFSHAQTWTALNGTPNIGAYNATLLMDGSVMVQNADATDWWKLTPDSSGSYRGGTWKQLASTPGYGPLYYASAVLPDGRVFTMGGEYNLGVNDWQNQGFIYDPQVDKWTQVNAPSGWGQMGDTGSIMLPQGKLLIADPLNNQCAIFDPATNTMGTPFINGKTDRNDEEGLVLLPNGNVLTVDATNTPNSEIFNSKTLQWSFGGSTINNLVQANTEEIGPMVLRPDGTVICFGGSQHNSIYNTKTQTWSAGPDFPTASGGQLDAADAPACLLPSGNVIVETSPGFAQSGVQFFEWDGKALNAVPGIPTSSGDTSFTGGFLTLPTGELMFTNQSPAIYLYTSKGSADASWYPTITSAPASVQPGSSYVVSGTQFSGMSGASNYGDDEQNFTNYALVRITNNSSGKVVYCRAFNPSTYAVQTGSASVSTSFFVPKTIQTGPSTLQVVTNGLASKAVAITVGPPAPPLSVSTFIGTRLSASDDPNLISIVDGQTYNVRAVLSQGSAIAATAATFKISSTTIQSITVTASAAAAPGVTGQIYIFDNTPGLTASQQWVMIGATNLTSLQKSWSASAPGNVARFVDSSNVVKVLVRGLYPSRISTGLFTLSTDMISASG